LILIATGIQAAEALQLVLTIIALQFDTDAIAEAVTDGGRAHDVDIGLDVAVGIRAVAGSAEGRNRDGFEVLVVEVGRAHAEADIRAGHRLSHRYRGCRKHRRDQ
jgi:hypothetical protein